MYISGESSVYERVRRVKFLMGDNSCGKNFRVVKTANSLQKGSFLGNYFFPQLQMAFPQLVYSQIMTCGKSCGKVVEEFWTVLDLL
jgi:hypothetical protein